MEDISVDHFYRGRVTVAQGKKGYRFSVDAPILADFLPVCPGKRALDIGTGSGVVALLALYLGKFASVLGVEIQERLSSLAERNARENSFTDRFQVVRGDFNENYRRFQGLTEVFSNPPFLPLGQGKESPNPEIRDARSETQLRLPDLLSQTYSLLGQPGNLYLIYDYARFDELMRLSTEVGFFLARLRLVFPFKDGKAKRFLVQLTNYRVSASECEPLTIFASKGRYSDEMEDIFSRTV